MSIVRVVDYQAADCHQQLAASLHEIGFAVIRNHPLDQSLIDRTYEIWEDFFCGDDKFNYLFDPKTHAGYVGLELSEKAKGYDVADIKEFYHYYPWGPAPDCVQEVTRKLYGDLSVFAQTLLQGLEQQTPAHIREKFAMPLAKMIEDAPRTLFRLIHYPPLTGDEPQGALRAQAHEDICMLTVLPAATAEGLQVKDKSGQWLDVPINPNWIIINAGDMLSEATEHYFPSTSHRVANPTGEHAKKSRLSMPLFLHPKDGIRLSDRYTTDQYLHERYEELGLT